MWGRGSHRTARPPLPPPWLARAPPGEVPESTYLKESGAGSSPASHNLLLAHVFFEIHNLDLSLARAPCAPAVERGVDNLNDFDDFRTGGNDLKKLEALEKVSRTFFWKSRPDSGPIVLYVPCSLESGMREKCTPHALARWGVGLKVEVVGCRVEG